MESKQKLDRKLSRVGGSVVIAIPKKVRREMDIGVGDRMRMTVVAGRYIVMERGSKVRGENTYLKD